MPNYTGSVGRTLNEKLGEFPSVLDFGAVADGATDNASAFAAMASMVNGMSAGKILTITLPPGEYLYSDGLVFTKQVRLVGYGATLNYTGSGKAATFGPTTLTALTEDQQHYEIEGVTLTGGASMTHGLYFSPYVTMPRLKDIYCYNFGNATAWSIFFQWHNWDIVMLNCRWYTSPGVSVGRNWVRVNGKSTGGTTDYGNSRLRMHACLGTNQDPAGGRGVYVTGAHSLIQGCKIESFAPNVQVAGYAQWTKIVEDYFEVTTTGNSITYGGDDDNSWSQFLTVENCYCNTHNSDGIAANAYFIGPYNVNIGLQYAVIRNNNITSCNREIVKQNNLAGQTGNRADDNTTNTAGHIDQALHTAGSNISAWNGTGGDEFRLQNFRDYAQYVVSRPGSTANQYQGLTLQDKDGNELVTIEADPTGRINIKNKDASTPTMTALLNAFVTILGQWNFPLGALIKGLTAQSVDADSVAAYVRAFAGQNVDVFRVEDSVGTSLVRVQKAGTLETHDVEIVGAAFGRSVSLDYSSPYFRLKKNGNLKWEIDADGQITATGPHVVPFLVKSDTGAIELQTAAAVSKFKVDANGDIVTCRGIAASGDVDLTGLTASLPLKLNASKRIIASKIDIGASADVTASGFSANEIAMWGGTALVGVAGTDASQAFVTSASASGTTGAIPSTVDTTGMSGDVLTVANKLNSLINALGVGNTLPTGIGNATKTLAATKGVITSIT